MKPVCSFSSYGYVNVPFTYNIEENNRVDFSVPLATPCGSVSES